MSRVIVVAPAPIDGSGGVARIYNFAHALSCRGHECHVYVFNSDGASAATLAENARVFYATGNFVIHTSLQSVIGSFDLAIATRWDTPAMVMKIEARHRVYLVQDYEAFFNPVGDGSLLAENSYMLGLRPLTYGRWLAAKLAHDFGNDPYHFDFASDTQTFRCDLPMEQRRKSQQSVVFIYQADKVRRCPHLGIEALGIVKHRRPNVNLNFVGSNNAPHLWYDFRNVGNLTTSELNALYNQCHVGVSLSSSNPSCNAFDMMAAGLPSVDLFRENNLYDVPPQGVLLAYQSAASIAEAIIHLLDNPVERATRSRSGIEFMASRAQSREVENFLVAIDDILEGDADTRNPVDRGSILYDQAPVVASIDRTQFVDAYLLRQSAAMVSARSNQHDPRSKLSAAWHAISVKAEAKLSYYPTAISSEIDLPPTPEVQQTAAEKYDQLGQRLVRRFGLDPRLSAKLFDSEHYLAHSPDVAAAGLDPFAHFIKYGIAEGRSPSPFFEADWYAATYPEATKNGMTAIGHYITRGSALNQSPNSMFDPIWYFFRYTDIRPSRMHPLLHYLQYGEAERRDPSSKFSTNWYLDAHPDVRSSLTSPLRHYIEFGRSEAREPVASRPADLRNTGHVAARSDEQKATDFFSRTAKATDLEPYFVREEREVLDKQQQEAQVSFDVWSTIIHRRCHPDEIKLRSARFLLLNAWQDVRPALRSTVLLMAARMRAENDSAPHNDHEYRFEDATVGWLRDVLLPDCAGDRRAELSTLLMTHESAAEVGSIEVDNNIARTIRSLKKPPIFISDFYMQTAFIEPLLAHVGVGHHFIRGYASCDIYKNKRSGELFSYVLNDFQIAAADLIHIGDNPLSDFERPASMGIKTVPYVSRPDEERNDWYADAFNELRVGNVSIHQRRMKALAENVASEATAQTGKADLLFDAGCRIGLLAFGYCVNIIEDAIARQAKEVVFFAREGILFKQIYDAIAADNPFDTPVPPSRLIYVSRRATFAASLRTYDNEDLMRLWRMYWRQSPIAFARSLNLDPDKTAAATRRVGIAPNDIVSAPWADAGFQAFLNDPEFKSYLADDLLRQRDLLQRYLCQEVDQDQEELLIVDIGWRGTIQDNIANVWKNSVRGHYLALFGYLNPQGAGNSKVGWLSDANTLGEYVLPDRPAPIEMIFNGLGGSTIGYEERDGRIEPVREIFAAEESAVEALAACRAGILAIVPSLTRYVRLHGLMAADLVDLSRKVASDLLASPPTAIADIFGRLEHNETFGVGAVEAMDELDFAQVTATPPGAKLHGALKTWLGARWPDGMSRQSAVTDWWRLAPPEVLASAPLTISRAQSPAIVRSVGSRLAVYVPAPMEASGGYKTIMSTVKALSNIGFNAEIHVETIEGNSDLLDSYLGDIQATVVSGWAAHRTPTLALATIAHSAGFVSRQVAAEYKGYLVQDDESVFHPLSDASIRAENSYAYGLHHFTIGNWLTHLIRKKYGAPAYPAGLGIDTSIYQIDVNVSREKAICVLYQPDKMRRASDLALRAVEIVKLARPETKIYVYGSHQLPDLDCDYQNLGVIDDLSQLNSLYNRCRAGLCLSLSNPSRIPFEMAAAGCRPVDLYRYNNLMDHTDGASILAFQSPDSVAQGLLATLDDEADVGLALAGRVSHRTLEWESDAIVANVLRVLDNRPDEGWSLRPSFASDPVIAAVDDTHAARQFCLQQWASATA